MGAISSIGSSLWNGKGTIEDIASAVGHVALNGAKFLRDNVGAPILKEVGAIGIDAATYGGEAAVRAGKWGVESFIDGDARNPAVFALKNMSSLGKHMATVKPYTKRFDEKSGKVITEGGVDITTAGVAVAGIVAGIGGLVGVQDELRTKRMGTVDPTKYTATPSYQPHSYDIIAATGSGGNLALALNATRRGGYL